MEKITQWILAGIDFIILILFRFILSKNRNIFRKVKGKYKDAYI